MKITVGDQVVVNRVADTPLYTVEETLGGMSRLSYMSGKKKLGGGEIPNSCLRTPSKAQRKYHGITS